MMPLLAQLPLPTVQRGRSRPQAAPGWLSGPCISWFSHGSRGRRAALRRNRCS